jgi:pimeloyl-ACP methyl ester carboxylesterase
MADAPSIIVQGHAVHLEWQPPRGNLPCFVLIHGGGLDHSAWLPPAARLAARGYGVLAPDLPGHGKSGAPACQDIPSMAAWMVDLIEAMRMAVPNVAPLILAGHSMGAMIALECAGIAGRSRDAATPRIAGVALLGTAFPLAVSPALLDLSQSDEAEAQRKVNAWSHALPRPGEGEIPAATSAAMADNLACMARQRPGVLHSDFKACSLYADGWLRAAELPCPALMVLGEKDRMTPPRAAEGLATALKVRVATTTEIIPGTGHNLMGEQPETVANALIAFAGRIAARP